MKRRLFNLAAAVSLVLCLLTILLWSRDRYEWYSVGFRWQRHTFPDVYFVVGGGYKAPWEFWRSVRLGHSMGEWHVTYHPRNDRNDPFYSSGVFSVDADQCPPEYIGWPVGQPPAAPSRRITAPD